MIAAYCVVVFVTSCSRTVLFLVAADDMLSMSPMKGSINSSTRISHGGGTWERLLDVAGRTVSLLYEIPWMCAAALAKPKESAEGLEC